MTCILELNDVAVTLYRDTTVLERSPGMAVVLDDDVQFGNAALKLSRIHPRQANQQYLTRLNADPLPVPGRRARNHADLVYLHLQSLKPLIEAEGGEVLLAVPGILSPDQLGVLLGVLQEVGIRVSGFVDAAVAALSTRAVAPRAYHLDVMMQRAVVTAIEADQEVSKTGAQEVLECGLNRLLDGWINVIADRFVRETRFDPLHAAATEQQLFNQVYDWIDRGATADELVVEIVHADHSRRVELGRSVLEDKSAQRLAQIADAIPQGARVYLSARSASLPGLRRALDGLRAEVVDLPGDALAVGCLRHLDLIIPGDGDLRLVTRLPHGDGRARADAGESATAATAGPAAAGPAAAGPAAAGGAAGASVTEQATLAPTHALQGHRAVPLHEAMSMLPLERRGDRVLLTASAAVRLNGRPLEDSQALQPGDRVTVDATEFLIIHVDG